MNAPLLRTLDVVLVPGTGDGSLEPVTLALAADTDPVWSPDGARVAFRSLQDGQANLFTHAVHRANAADEPLLRSPLDETPTDWRDGRVLFQAPDTKSGFDVWTLTLATGAREPIVKGAFNETDGRWSPDGQSIAYVSDESGSPDIYVTPTRGGVRVRVSFAGGSRPRWSRDGRALFFLRGSQILRADVVAGSDGSGRSPQPDLSPRFSTPRPVIDVPGIRDFDVAHRRDALVALVPAQAASPTPVTALVDWMSLVPTP
jgi:eukaryotic-like serine/threonine-protein kinase